MRPSMYAYIIVGGLVTYFIRLLPFTIIRKPIKNRFIQSFLHYVPYITLSAMIFPAILYETGSVWIGAAALAVGLTASWFNVNGFLVALICSGVVYVLELLCL